MTGPLKVVLIGPESTGKTRLAQALVERYGVHGSSEYVREYVAERGRVIEYADVDAIGRGQKAEEDATVARGARLGMPLVILDTDLVSTAVYSRHYYGDCPQWIEKDAKKRLGDLYLLHHVDVPWESDGAQREQPERREDLFESFRATLADLGARVAQIRGSWDDRLRRAIQSVDRLLG